MERSKLAFYAGTKTSREEITTRDTGCSGLLNSSNNRLGWSYSAAYFNSLLSVMDYFSASLFQTATLGV